MSAPLRHVEEALALRRDFLATMAGAAVAPAFLQARSRESWDLFLKVERCASPLRGALLGGRKAPASLTDWLVVDAQRTLAVRAHLALIVSIAQKNDWPVVILKGAATAALGEPIHLVDLDVLVRPQHASAMAASLSERLGIPLEGRPSPRHLAAIAPTSTLPIEIHTSIDNRWTNLTARAWERLRPLETFPGLWRLGAQDHALHLLTHVVIDHPDRRGRIRDTLLIGQALAECEERELEQIEEMISHSPYAKPLRSQYSFARNLVRRRPCEDPFEAAAFSRYWLVAREERRRPPTSWLGQALYPTVWMFVIPQVAGWPKWQRIVDGLNEPAAAPSELRITAWLERQLPPIGSALRVGLRTIQYLGAMAIAWPIARQIRRAARASGVTIR